MYFVCCLCVCFFDNICLTACVLAGGEEVERKKVGAEVIIQAVLIKTSIFIFAFLGAGSQTASKNSNSTNRNACILEYKTTRNCTNTFQVCLDYRL